MKTIDTQFLTDTQINRRIQATAKRWLKAGLEFRFISDGMSKRVKQD